MVYNCICNIIRASSQIAQRNRRACGASGCEAAILSHLVCILQFLCGGSRFASLLDHIVADRIIARFSAGVLDRQLCAGFRNATDAYLDPRGLCGSRRELHTCHPTECLTLRMEYNCVCHIVRIGSQAIQVCRSACCPSRCEIVILRHLAGSFQFLCGGSRFASLLDHIVADRIGTCFFAGILNRQLRAGLRNVTDAYCRTGYLIQIRCSGDRNNPNQQDKRHQKRNCGVSCFPYMCFQLHHISLHKARGIGALLIQHSNPPHI